ncbi:MAG: hypothetical protein EYC62_01085 [Alphaproteobacteria bacterium]|nr:MAG: hypothetical protein EYC62_01085 [Alphaproteobacteria bacterium]
MTEDNTEESKPEYEIGYRKPPKNTRFSPGKSGNPKGRPKGAKGLSTVFMEEANKRVTVRTGNSTQKLTQIQAIIKRLFHKAMEGDSRAIAKVVEVGRIIEPQLTLAETERQDVTQEDEAIIQDLLRRRGMNND